MGLIASIVLVSFNLPEIKRKAKIAKTLEFSQSLLNTLGAEAVLLLNFDEGQGNQAKDGSGYNNHGILHPSTDPPQWTDETPHKVIATGEGRHALEFDGEDDYVDCGNDASLNITDEITIEAWIKTGKVGRGAIYARGLGTGNDTQAMSYFFFVDVDYPGKIRLRISNGTTENTVYSNTSVNDNVWHHVAASFDGTTLKIYIDGVNEKTESQDITPQVGDRTYIGRKTQSPFGWQFKGFIDEVRIYNQALSEAAIQRHYTKGLERHKNLAVK
jgi:hypothetical protein